MHFFALPCTSLLEMLQRFKRHDCLPSKLKSGKNGGTGGKGCFPIKFNVSSRNLVGVGRVAIRPNLCSRAATNFDQTFHLPNISAKHREPCGLCSVKHWFGSSTNILKPFALLSLCMSAPERHLENQNSWHLFLLRHTDSNDIPKKQI